MIAILAMRESIARPLNRYCGGGTIASWRL
jgi:hypothetical protein